ncbi:unnamed protein product [Cunninghamella blakesleeana]
MVSTKENILPVDRNDKGTIHTNDQFDKIKLGYPSYENDWITTMMEIYKWLLYLFSLYVTFRMSYDIGLVSYLFDQNQHPNTLFGVIVTMIYYQFVPPLITLMLAFITGQFNQYYIIFCHHFIYKHVLPRSYILNRTVSSIVDVSPSKPYYYDD